MGAALYFLGGCDDHCFLSPSGDGGISRPAIKVKDLQPIDRPATRKPRPELQKLSDLELLEAVSRPRNGDPIQINTRTGVVSDGNGRAWELKRRAIDPNSSITPDTEIPYEQYTPTGSPITDC